jgi:hypothetical protein
VVVEHLRHRAPADVFYKFGLVVVGGGAGLRFETAERLDGGEIPLKLLLRSALAETVGFGDAVVAEVLRRFFLMATVAVS